MDHRAVTNLSEVFQILLGYYARVVHEFPNGTVSGMEAHLRVMVSEAGAQLLSAAEQVQIFSYMSYPFSCGRLSYVSATTIKFAPSAGDPRNASRIRRTAQRTNSVPRSELGSKLVLWDLQHKPFYRLGGASITQPFG